MVGAFCVFIYLVVHKLAVDAPLKRLVRPADRVPMHPVRRVEAERIAQRVQPVAREPLEPHLISRNRINALDQARKRERAANQARARHMRRDETRRATAGESASGARRARRIESRRRQVVDASERRMPARRHDAMVGASASDHRDSSHCSSLSRTMVRTAASLCRESRRATEASRAFRTRRTK